MTLTISIPSRAAPTVSSEREAQKREHAGWRLETDYAAVNAARLRFRAVMMAALSFILGVLPLVFASGVGAASRTLIGFVVLGGMVAAMVGGFVPVLYSVVERAVGGRRVGEVRSAGDPI